MGSLRLALAALALHQATAFAPAPLTAPAARSPPSACQSAGLCTFPRPLSPNNGCPTARPMLLGSRCGHDVGMLRTPLGYPLCVEPGLPAGAVLHLRELGD